MDVDSRQIEKMDVAEFRTRFGNIRGSKLSLPSAIKSEIKKEVAEIEQEDGTRDDIALGHGIAILLRRARKMREMKQDDRMRATMK